MNKIVALTYFRAACLFCLGALLTLALDSRTARADTVVGSGTPASCTETAFTTALSAGGSITFNCGTAPVTITLTSQKQISIDASIDGGGLITLSGSTSSLFQVFSTHALTLRNVVLANGSSASAGAIENFGTTTIVSSQIVNNHSSSNGGALLNQGAMTVMSSTLSSNVASSRGGAIMNDGGTLTVTASSITDNHVTAAGGSGGGIYNNAGAASIFQSAISGNTAQANGGGIYSLATLDMENDTLSGNHAVTGGGGGIYQGTGSGGLSYITVADNSAAFGGGVYEDGASGGVLSLLNTLLAGNSVGNCDGVITSVSHNLSSDTHCGSFTQLGDLTNTPAHLGQLANNGGPTATHMLLAGSPAIDAGLCQKGQTTGGDQRGVNRPQGPACDIGAIERKTGDTGAFLYLPFIIR